MNVLLNELRVLAAEIETRCTIVDDPDAEVLKLLESICNNRFYYVALVNIPRLQPVFFCSKGMEVLGISSLKEVSGMSFYARFLSKDNFSVVKEGLTHFANRPNEPFPMTYRVHTRSMGWRWFYGVSVPFGDTRERVTYTLTILRDVEDSFEHWLSPSSQTSGRGVLPVFKARRMLQLSEREKDVLLLMAEDLTSQQMADTLHISKDTVQFHRKQLKRKLQVKTSQGLVRYAIHLQSFMDEMEG